MGLFAWVEEWEKSFVKKPTDHVFVEKIPGPLEVQTRRCEKIVRSQELELIRRGTTRDRDGEVLAQLTKQTHIFYSLGGRMERGGGEMGCRFRWFSTTPNGKMPLGEAGAGGASRGVEKPGLLQTMKVLVRKGGDPWLSWGRAPSASRPLKLVC